MKKWLFSLSLMVSSSLLQSQTISLNTFSTGYSSPLDIAFAPGDDRMYVVQQRGIIKYCDTGGNILGDFINLTSLVSQTGNERGLLGLAFHPDYQNNGYFYVNYTRSSGGATRISRFSRSTVNPNIGDPGSEVVLLEITQPYTNHNGGCIKFGNDGYLYIGMGDGGSAGDPQNRAQNPLVLLGKMLRIDVNQAPYQIPTSNPYYGQLDTLPEIWALGMRNPWRFSFDKLTHDLWIGDVGQDAVEEVDFQPSTSTGGENYGWRCYEGNVTYNTTGCQTLSYYDAPVAAYTQGSTHCSVTGGFVYRGANEGDIYGKYIYIDVCSGRFFETFPNGLGGWTTNQLNAFNSNTIVSFGENHQGDLFAADLGNGTIYSISTTACLPSASVYGQNGRTAICSGDSLLLTTPQGTGFTYQWYFNSNPVVSSNNDSLYATSPGNYYVVVTNGSNCTNTSSVFTVTTSSTPTVTITAPSDACSNETNVPLTGLPLGGIFSGTGVGPGEFYPSSVGAGNYDVIYTYTNSEGCTSSDTAMITVNAVPNPSITNLPSSYCLDDATINLNGSPTGGTFSGPGVTGSTFDPLSAGVGTHQVTYSYTDGNGCSGQDTVSVTISDCDVSVEENGLITKWSLFPNPTSDVLKLEIDANEKSSASLKIISIDGRIIYTGNLELENGSNLFVIDVTNYSSGIYQLQLSTDRTRVRPFVINK